jgi:hypothetical protein
MKKPTLISARSASKNASKPQQTVPSQPHPDILLSGVLAEKEAAGVLGKHAPVSSKRFAKNDLCSAQQYVSAREPGLSRNDRDLKARALMA